MAAQALEVARNLTGIHAGGRRSKQTGDLRLLVRGGLPAEAVKAIALLYGLDREAIVRHLGISESTLRRRLSTGRLTPVESDRLYRIADVGARAEEVLGTRDKAATWLQASNRALDGEPPLLMLDTEVGYERVKDVLGRIEHGIYS